MNFRRSIIIAELWQPEVARRWKKSFFRSIGKTTPYGKIIKIMFRKDSSPHRRDVFEFSWNLAVGRWEIGKVMRYLPGKKFAWLSSSRYCADRAQNLPGPAPDNVFRVFHISSKSVHFLREHRHSALESESNIRLRPSFEPNKCNAPDPETVKRCRDEVPLHINNVQIFAYSVSWRFCYAGLISIISRVTINVASSFITVAVCHMSYPPASSSSLSRTLPLCTGL